jgi:hypothetical protein
MPIAICCLLLAACDRTPEVFSVNNFSMVNKDSIRARMGVTALPIPEITGHWTGLQHDIDINITNGYNRLTFYSVALIDTIRSKDSGTAFFDIDFMAVNGLPYIEVLSYGGQWDIHDFRLVLSTYIKINKLTIDTIIMQMLNSKFTEGWLKAKGYKYFVTTEDKGHKDHPIYLTENLPRLATLLKQLYRVPQAFQVADTIVRKK